MFAVSVSHRSAAVRPSFVRAAALALALLIGPGGGLGAADLRAPVLRTNLPDDLPTADPAAFLGATGSRVLGLVYEGLTAVAADGELVPALAVGWEPLDGGRGWRFQLRPNVRFHSGRPLSAADVRATFEALLTTPRPGIGATFLVKLVGAEAFAQRRVDRLAGFTEIDPLTFEVRFTEPVALFPHYPFLIFDRAAVGPDGARRASAGTGPFRLTDWRRGQEVRLEANREHWGGPPAIDGLRFQIIPSADTALLMFETGALDFVSVSDTALRRVADTPRLRAAAVAVPRQQVRFLGMNQGLYPPFADPRVRVALALALDRAAVVDGLYGGYATLPGWYPPRVPGHGADPEAPPPTDAVARARRLLAEAGYPDGRGLPPLDLVAIDAGRDEAAYYAHQLRQGLGLPVTVRTRDRSAFVSAANAGALAFFFGGWSADYPDPMTLLGSLWHSASPYNQTRWRDDALDQLLDGARAALDGAERDRLYKQAGRRLTETVPAVPLAVPMHVLLRHPQASGVAPTPFGLLAVAGVPGQRPAPGP
ncbi:ABC transporter substrate-binding protein [Azospirillum soli]|uniref:ABC transporter substrate-binding protein n=1 Tax=Azospirillum soli TaxID=1304799 RepID=UPI001AE65E2E|nr:ABC transporter substrate-binding protein [Azospirillum soli]MBP2312952.1 ABC-type transport system substrate-binding protein [Azospirillum soli]